MKITDIYRYKGDTYCIEFDGTDEKIYVHENIVYDFHLKKGTGLDEDDIEAIKNAQLYRKARERALYFLDNRDYSFTGLYEKLSRDYDDDICMRVCKELAAGGIISDRRYAENLAEFYTVTKRYGFYRAKQEMMKKGITPAIAEEYLSPYSDTEEERLAEIFEEKYLRTIDSPKALNRAKSALARLGYSYSEINDVLREYSFEFDGFHPHS